MASGKKGSNPPRKFVCQYCGKTFKRIVYPSQDNPQFCGMPCRNRHLAETNRLKKTPCPVCGTPFKPYRQNGRRKTHCSNQCAATNRGHTVWTDAMRKAVEKRYPTEGWQQLAEKLSTTRAAIQSVAYRAGVTLEPQPNKKGRNPPQEFVCKGCGKPFERVWYPSRKKPQYCSTKCRRVHTTIVCETCGKQFEVPECREDTRKYCSKECHNESMRRSKKTCLFCGNVYRPTSSSNVGYCSIQCSASARKATRLHKTCEWCGEEFIVKKGYTEARFCSMTCSANGIALRGPDNPNWLGGCVRWRGENWDEQRMAALKRDGYKCQECGVTGVPLDVHHIVRFRYFDDWREANRLDNLMSVCRSCHTTLDAENRKRNENGQFIVLEPHR